MQIIPKYQSGGYIDMFTSYDSMYSNKRSYSDETNTKTSKKSSDSSDSSEKGQLTEKDFFSMLEKVNALPNERRAIISQLMDVFSESSLLERDTSDIKILYLQTLDQISQASINKNIYDEAIKSVQTNDAGGDVAISQSGKLVTLNNKGDLGYISLEEYYDDPESYTLISNSDLANFRRNSSSFINDQQAFDILQNAMSYKTFQQLVDQAKNSLGTMEYNREGLFASQNNKIVQGQKLLESLKENDQVQALGSVTANGLYEYDVIDKNQLQQIKAFTQYITTLLPERAKTWASLKSGNPDKNKAISDLVETYLISGQNITHDFNIDYKGSMEKVTGNKDSSEENSFDKLKLNTAGQFYLGYGDDAKFVVNPGTTVNFVVDSTTKSLTNKSGDPLGSMCLLQEVTTGQYAEMLDYNNAVMGNIKIPISSFNHIVIEDGQIYSIDMPLNDKGNPNMTPEVRANREAAMKELKENNIDINNPESVNANIDKINSIMEKHQLPQMYNSQGKLIAGNWGRFAVMNGFAFEPVLGVDDNGSSSLLQEETDEVIVNSVKESIETKLKSKYNVDVNDSWLEWGYDELYKGTIWIPIKDNFFNTLNQDITVKQSLEIAEREHQKRLQQSYNKGAWN